MAWEAGLSYSPVLADLLREQLELKSVMWLATAIANDKYARVFPVYTEGSQRAFDRWVRKLATLPLDVLVDECMRRAERTDTADNGGGVIWIDKGGCSRVRLG